MRARFFACGALAITATLVMAFPGQLTAGNPFNIARWFTGAGVDVHPHEYDEDGNLDASEPCIDRYPVDECVIGKLELYDSEVKYEYVSIPETRYYWKKVKLTKEIPCPHQCLPVGKTEEGVNYFGEEKWEKYCSECGQLHCKHITPKAEKAQCKYCDTQDGEATIKVKYWSCVKVPYTVYRQVRRQVCVKQPYYEDVEVPITKYICEDCDESDCDYCDGTGCEHCQGNGTGCEHCQGNGTGCAACDGGSDCAQCSSADAQCSPADAGTASKTQSNDPTITTTNRNGYPPALLFSNGLNDDTTR